MDCLSMQERVRLVERVLSLSGLEPVRERNVARRRSDPRDGNGSEPRRAGAGAAH